MSRDGVRGASSAVATAAYGPADRMKAFKAKWILPGWLSRQAGLRQI